MDFSPTSVLDLSSVTSSSVGSNESNATFGPLDELDDGHLFFCSICSVDLETNDEGQLIPFFGCTCIPIDEHIPDAIIWLDMVDIPRFAGYGGVGGRGGFAGFGGAPEGGSRGASEEVSGSGLGTGLAGGSGSGLGAGSGSGFGSGSGSGFGSGSGSGFGSGSGSGFGSGSGIGFGSGSGSGFGSGSGIGFGSGSGIGFGSGSGGGSFHSLESHPRESVVTNSSNSWTVLQSAASVSAKVQPLVIFNICDFYVRRPDQSDRVIGTLLGTVLPDGTVDIRNCYGVPHNESSDQQVALDKDYHHNMLSSHIKVYPKEVIVGWFSTGSGVTGGSALIHDFYSRQVSNPVHLIVDTGFKNGEAGIKAFVFVGLSLGGRQLAAQFQEIPLDLRMIEAERVGFDILKTNIVDKFPSNLEGMETSMKRLLTLIDDVYKYVDDVVEGKVAPDYNIGRFISDAVATLPKISPPEFDKLMNATINDELLLLYLSTITRTQLNIAEELNTAAQIL